MHERTGTEVFGLLARVIDQHPDLSLLTWEVKDNCAVATTVSMGSITQEGSAIKVTPSPDVLAIVNRLHAAGWKRGDVAGDFWKTTDSRMIRAYLKMGPALVVVSGITWHPPGSGNGAVPYFAPPPPDITGLSHDDWMREYQAWEKKCQEDAW